MLAARSAWASINGLVNRPRRFRHRITIGGAVSVDAFGPGRLRHGPARDSLLAFRGINGLGESFRGGAKVVKNVTRLPICPSWSAALSAPWQC